MAPSGLPAPPIEPMLAKIADALPAETITSLNTIAQAQGLQPLFAPGDYEKLFEPLREGAPLPMRASP